jgi:hypothetical protein
MYILTAKIWCRYLESEEEDDVFLGAYESLQNIDIETILNKLEEINTEMEMDLTIMGDLNVDDIINYCKLTDDEKNNYRMNYNNNNEEDYPHILNPVDFENMFFVRFTIFYNEINTPIVGEKYKCDICGLIKYIKDNTYGGKTGKLLAYGKRTRSKTNSKKLK